MKKAAAVKMLVIAVLGAFALCTGVSLAAPEPSPAAAAPASVDTLTRAKAWFSALQSGKVDRTQMTDTMNKDLSDEQIKNLSAKYGPLGDPTSFEQVKTGSEAGSSVYTYRLAFSNGDHLNFLFAIDGNDKVSGLYILPPQ